MVDWVGLDWRAYIQYSTVTVVYGCFDGVDFIGGVYCMGDIYMYGG